MKNETSAPSAPNTDHGTNIPDSPKEVTLVFKPQPDITAYELAQIFASFVEDTRYGCWFASFEKNPDLRRHFEVQELETESKSDQAHAKIGKIRMAFDFIRKLFKPGQRLS